MREGIGMSEGMEAPAATPAMASAPAIERVNLLYHVIIGAAEG